MASFRYLVDDVDAAVSFYERHLGFSVVQRWGGTFAIVSKDDVELWLSGPGSSAARPMPDGRRPEAGGWNRVVIEVRDIESTVAAMKAEGVGFRNEIVEGPGGKQTVMEDVAGNPIELFEPA